MPPERLQKDLIEPSPFGKVNTRNKVIDDRFLIITGLSGSGKTSVSRFLEDFGYYCVDNLPSKLIPIFVDLWKKKEVEIEKVALIVDIREDTFLTEFPKVLRTIRQKISPRVIFLDASDESLIKRFSESRRPHPLKSHKSIKDSVAMERKRLAEIKNLSDEVINTTDTSVNDLKKIMTQRFAKKRAPGMQVVMVSFGYKYGVPLDSDLIFDTRFLPNPFYIDRLREKTGKNRSVQKYVLDAPETQKFLREIKKFIKYLMPNFVEEGKSYLTISIGCTGGKHRSVVLAEQLGDYLKSLDYKIQINHRDIYK